MKIWLLKAKEGSPEFEPWYDKTFGFVVIAENEEAARSLAYRHRSDHSFHEMDDHYKTWYSDKDTTCEIIGYAAIEKGVVLRDHRAA